MSCALLASYIGGTITASIVAHRLLNKDDEALREIFKAVGGTVVSVSQ